MDAQSDLQEFRSEIQIRGRAVNGIAARITSAFTCPASISLTSFAEPIRLRTDFEWIGVRHRLARVAQRLIHRVNQCVHRRRLRFACNESSSFHGAYGDRAGERQTNSPRRPAPANSPRSRELRRRGQRARKRLDRRRVKRQPVVRHCARIRRRRLDHVKPVHLRARIFDTAPIRKISRVAHARRAA